MFEDLTGTQKELLAHIEFMGRFYGLVSRLDLTSRFDAAFFKVVDTFFSFKQPVFLPA